jgi:hypothetical protein
MARREQALLLPAQLLKRTGFYLSSKAMYFVRLLSFVVYAVPHWVLVVEPAATGVRGIVGSCDLTLMPPSATVPVMEALRAADCMPRDRQVPPPADGLAASCIAPPPPRWAG